MNHSDPGAPATGVPICYRHPGRETWIRCQRCERPICPDCMNEASVGFQCPDCVREGHRTTRQIQGRYGGAPSTNPALTTMVLIGINVVVWLAVNLTGRYGSRLLELLQLSSSGRCASDEAPGSWYPQAGEQVCGIIDDGRWIDGFATGAWWQPLTSAFTHVEVWHLGMNMLVLWFLGPQIEALLGRARFLALYLLSALGGSVAVLWLSGPSVTTVGASGAIWGLLGALLILAWRTGSDVRGVLVWIGINAAIPLVVPNISWQAHLGGLVVGAVLTAAMVFAPREQRSLVQWGAVGATSLVLLAACVARVLAG
jgi:membrane associated rhomboid family serine protease